jgi:hypothetical protein
MVHQDTDGLLALLAAVIEHLACHLQTGRPRSLHLATLLLERLAADEGAGEPLRERCMELQAVLEERSSPVSPLPIRPGNLPGQPWLTWQVVQEAA